jgi:hypothetical protein
LLATTKLRRGSTGGWAAAYREVIGEGSGVLGDEDTDILENQRWPMTRALLGTHGCWPAAMQRAGRSEDESGEGARGGMENLQGTLAMMQGAPAPDSC